MSKIVFRLLVKLYGGLYCLFLPFAYVDVDVVDLRAQADASMPASNNNVSYTVYSNF